MSCLSKYSIVLSALIVLVLMPLTSLAGSDKRPSTVNLSLTSGEGGYSAVNLYGAYGLDTTWRFMGSVATSKSEDNSNSIEARVGADARFTPPVLAKLSFFSRAESVGVRGVGATPGVDWTISSLWGGRLNTILFLDLEITRYSILSLSRNRRIQSSDDLRQRATTLGLIQELSPEWSISASATGFDYDGKDPDAWADELAYFRQVSTGIESTAKGFLKSTSSLGVTWDTLGSFIFNLTLNTTKSTLGTVTKGASLNTTYLVNEHWSADLNLAGSNTEGSGTNSGSLGLGVGYLF